MSILARASTGRKPGSATTRPLLGDLDPGIPPKGIFRSFDLGPPVTLPFEVFRLRPPGCVYEVAAFLDFKCSEFSENWSRSARAHRPCYGVYCDTDTIADEMGLGESSVRARGLKWLIAHDLVEPQEFVGPDGRRRVMLWVKWRFPRVEETIRLQGELDLGGGVKAAISEGPPKTFRPEPGAAIADRPPAPKHARMAPIPAPDSAPEALKGIKSQTTTDRAGEVVVEAAPSGGGGDPPSPPPLDPGLAGQLGAIVPEADRAEVLAEAPAWAARYPAHWPAAAAKVAAKQRRAGKVRTTLAAYLAGVMETWEREGSGPKATLPGPGSNGSIPTAEAEARKAREEARAMEARAAEEARVAELRARWERLPEAEREAIVGRVLAANPMARRWGPVMLEPLYLAALGAA